MVVRRGDVDVARGKRVLVVDLDDPEPGSRLEELRQQPGRVGAPMLHDDDRQGEGRRQTGQDGRQGVEPAPRRTDYYDLIHVTAPSDRSDRTRKALRSTTRTPTIARSPSTRARESRDGRASRRRAHGLASAACGRSR